MGMRAVAGVHASFGVVCRSITRGFSALNREMYTVFVRRYVGRPREYARKCDRAHRATRADSREHTHFFTWVH